MALFESIKIGNKPLTSTKQWKETFPAQKPTVETPKQNIFGTQNIEGLTMRQFPGLNIFDMGLGKKTEYATNVGVNKKTSNIFDIGKTNLLRGITPGEKPMKFAKELGQGFLRSLKGTAETASQGFTNLLNKLEPYTYEPPTLRTKEDMQKTALIGVERMPKTTVGEDIGDIALGTFGGVVHIVGAPFVLGFQALEKNKATAPIMRMANNIINGAVQDIRKTSGIGKVISSIVGEERTDEILTLGTYSALAGGISKIKGKGPSFKTDMVDMGKLTSSFEKDAETLFGKDRRNRDTSQTAIKTQKLEWAKMTHPDKPGGNKTLFQETQAAADRMLNTDANIKEIGERVKQRIESESFKGRFKESIDLLKDVKSGLSKKLIKFANRKMQGGVIVPRKPEIPDTFNLSDFFKAMEVSAPKRTIEPREKAISTWKQQSNTQITFKGPDKFNQLKDTLIGMGVENLPDRLTSYNISTLPEITGMPKETLTDIIKAINRGKGGYKKLEEVGTKYIEYMANMKEIKKQIQLPSPKKIEPIPETNIEPMMTIGELFPDLPPDIKTDKMFADKVSLPKDVYETPQQAIMAIEGYRKMFKGIRDMMKKNNIYPEGVAKPSRTLRRFTTSNLLGTMGPGGKSIVGNIINSKLEKATDLAMMNIGKLIAIKNPYFSKVGRYKDKTKYIPKSQREELSDYIENGTISDRFNGKAPKLWDEYKNLRYEQITKPIAIMSTNVGIKEITPDITYVTHFLKKEIAEKFRKSRKQDVINMMIKEGIEGDKAEEIYNEIKVREEKSKLFGPLELPRTLTIIPKSRFERDISRIDNMYIEGSMNRIYDAIEFGPRDEILNYLLSQAGAIGEGGRLKEYKAGVFPRNMKNLVDEYRGLKEKNEFTRFMEDVAKFMTETTSIALLQLNSLQNWGDFPIKSITRYGVRRSLIGLGKYFTKKGKVLTKEMGVNPKEVERNMKSLGFVETSAGRWVYKATNEPVELGVRGATGLTAIEAVKRDFNFLKRTEGKKILLGKKRRSEARIRLQQHLPNENIDTLLKQDRLTEDQIIEIGINALKQTQPVGKTTVPIGRRTWAGRIFTQFRSYPFIHQKFLWEFVLKPLTRGNIKPLIRYLIIAPIIGELVLDIMAKVRGKERTKSIPKRIAQDYIQAGLGIYYQFLTQAVAATEYGGAGKLLLNFVGASTSTYLNLIFNIIHDIKATAKGQVAAIGEKSAPYRSQLLAVKQIMKILGPLGPLWAEKYFPSKTNIYGSDVILDKIWGESVSTGRETGRNTGRTTGRKSGRNIGR